MTLQEQIDYLKRQIAAIGNETARLSNFHNNIAYISNEYQPDPYCPECGIQMAYGYSCARPAEECVMGVGVLSGQKSDT